MNRPHHQQSFGRIGRSHPAAGPRDAVRRGANDARFVPSDEGEAPARSRRAAGIAAAHRAMLDAVIGRVRQLSAAYRRRRRERATGLARGYLP